MTVVCKCCNEKRSDSDVIMYYDYAVCLSCLNFYENSTGKKNSKSLKECDIFTLRIKNPNQLYYGLVEWGKAMELGKVLVIIYDFEYVVQDWNMFEKKLFKYLMKDSLKSFKKLSKVMKDNIMKKHKQFEVQNFKQYKEYIKNYSYIQNKTF